MRFARLVVEASVQPQPDKSGYYERALSEQLFDHRTVIDCGDRSASVIKEADFRVDAQDAEDRVVDITRSQRAVLWNLAQSIR